jgi:hypothetical protein
MIESKAQTYGEVEMLIEYSDGRASEKTTRQCRLNTILTGGKEAVVKSLAGDIGQTFSGYVCKMLFGTNGTVGGVPRFVDAGRNGLFGPTLISKNVTATLNPDTPNTVIFTAILTYSDAVGSTLNEMALQLANGDLYSMLTFGDITKSGTAQITYNWSQTIL